MIIIKNKEDYEFFEDPKKATEQIKKVLIHPDLLKIFAAEEISFNTLLGITEEPPINYPKIYTDTFKIKDKLLENLKPLAEHGLFLEHIVYPYGSVVDNASLKTGFNPVIKFTALFRAENDIYEENNHPPIIETRKIRDAAEKSIIDDWKVLKTKNIGNHLQVLYNWTGFAIFIGNERCRFFEE